ncbi:HD domain-containing protein [Paenibacillus sp. CC-CFT747]|nr:HD domain-containing protein [Paenibacillus sp. CC-CFT747]
MIFSDPIHGPIEVEDQDMQDMIETKAFQRLKGLKQQGNTYYLLPEASQTRYSHSLGVYANSAAILERLASGNDIRISDYERKLAGMAALLHDIGHGPYSHCFEHMTGRHHEEWSIRIIQEEEEVGGILDRTPGLRSDVVDVISKSGRFHVLEDVIFSQLGADSLDYHKRDHWHSGLKTDSFDLQKLIDHLSYKDHHLVIDRLAIPEIENLLKVRKDLFERGFGHPFVAGKDLLLKLIVRRASFLHESQGLESTPPRLLPILDPYAHWPVEDYLEWNDDFINQVVVSWVEQKDELLSHLSACYLNPAITLKWTEMDQEACQAVREKVSQPEWRFHTEVLVPNPKYGYYTGGIFVWEKDERVEVREWSPFIKEFSMFTPKSYLFYIVKSPLEG